MDHELSGLFAQMEKNSETKKFVQTMQIETNKAIGSMVSGQQKRTLTINES